MNAQKELLIKMDTHNWRTTLEGDNSSGVMRFVPNWLDAMTMVPIALIFGADERDLDVTTMMSVLDSVISALHGYVGRVPLTFAFRTEHSLVVSRVERDTHKIVVFQIRENIVSSEKKRAVLWRWSLFSDDLPNRAGGQVRFVTTPLAPNNWSASVQFTHDLAELLDVSDRNHQYTDDQVIDMDRDVEYALERTAARSAVLLRMLGTLEFDLIDLSSPGSSARRAKVAAIVKLAFEATANNDETPKQRSVRVREALARMSSPVSYELVVDTALAFYGKQIASMVILPVRSWPPGEIQVPINPDAVIGIDDDPRVITIISMLRTLRIAIQTAGTLLPPTAYPFAIAIEGTTGAALGVLDGEDKSGLLVVTKDTISLAQLGMFAGKVYVRRVMMQAPLDSAERLVVTTIPHDAPFNPLQTAFGDTGATRIKMEASNDPVAQRRIVLNDGVSIASLRRGAALSSLLDNVFIALVNKAGYAVTDMIGLVAFAKSLANARPAEMPGLYRIFQNYTPVLKDIIRDLVEIIFDTKLVQPEHQSGSSSDDEEVDDTLTTHQHTKRVDLCAEITRSKAKRSRDGDDDDNAAEEETEANDVVLADPAILKKQWSEDYRLLANQFRGELPSFMRVRNPRADILVARLLLLRRQNTDRLRALQLEIEQQNRDGATNSTDDDSAATAIVAKHLAEKDATFNQLIRRFEDPQASAIYEQFSPNNEQPQERELLVNVVDEERAKQKLSQRWLRLMSSIDEMALHPSVRAALLENSVANSQTLRILDAAFIEQRLIRIIQANTDMRTLAVVHDFPNGNADSPRNRLVFANVIRAAHLRGRYYLASRLPLDTQVLRDNNVSAIADEHVAVPSVGDTSPEFRRALLTRFEGPNVAETAPIYKHEEIVVGRPNAAKNTRHIQRRLVYDHSEKDALRDENGRIVALVDFVCSMTESQATEDPNMILVATQYRSFGQIGCTERTAIVAVDHALTSGFRRLIGNVPALASVENYAPLVARINTTLIDEATTIVDQDTRGKTVTPEYRRRQIEEWRNTLLSELTDESGRVVYADRFFAEELLSGSGLATLIVDQIKAAILDKFGSLSQFLAIPRGATLSALATRNLSNFEYYLVSFLFATTAMSFALSKLEPHPLHQCQTASDFAALLPYLPRPFADLYIDLVGKLRQSAGTDADVIYDSLINTPSERAKVADQLRSVGLSPIDYL